MQAGRAHHEPYAKPERVPRLVADPASRRVTGVHATAAPDAHGVGTTALSVHGEPDRQRAAAGARGRAGVIGCCSSSPLPLLASSLPEFWAFIPVYQSALAINDLVTATLLFTQFSILRSRALLVLACGYLFTCAMVVVHGLSFPGPFCARRVCWPPGPRPPHGFTRSGTSASRSL